MIATDIIRPRFLEQLADAAKGMATGNLNLPDVRCYWTIHYAALELKQRYDEQAAPKQECERE